MAYTGNACSFNNNSFNTNTIIQVPTPVADDKTQLLQWLSSLEPRQRHKHLRESRLDGVGEWIFRTNEFQRWNTVEDGSTHSVLFCHGDPGVGKTHLSSLVIDHFQGSDPDITVTALYCDYLDKKEQTTSNMIGAILKQVVGDGNIPEDMRKAFEVGKRHLGGVGPQTSELLKMLKTVLAQRQRVVICVDGLDESLPDHRTGLLKALREIIQELPNIQLFLTARPFILDEIKRYFTHMDTISVTPSKDDVKILLKTKLEEDPEPDAMDDHLRAQIMETIPKKVSEIFLLVSLTIEAILGETTIHRRREKLEHMTNGQDVGDVYTATLDRIKAQKKDRSRLGMEAIMWISHSERPLRPEELCQALGVQLQSEDLNNDNQPTIRTILSCGLGLITLDSSSATVRLVHFTLQEYILANPTLFHSPHSMIAEVCLTYLNYQCIRDLSPTLSSPPPAAPFLEYSSRYWGAHARRETTKRVKQLALRLLQQFDAHIACKLLLNEFRYFSHSPLDKQGRPLGFTGLHGAAFFGVQEIMIALLGIKDWDLNATGIHGRTVLSWAAGGGHDGIVNMLLERNDVDPNRADNSGQTPLSLAVENGHEGTAKMLLERNDIDPSRARWDGLTPFSLAARRGREGIVALMLERNDIDFDRADWDGRTPFSWAALRGHEGTVEMLLERNDIDPDRADSHGRTPFSFAAGNGHWGVVELLLERNDIDPDKADSHGRTPFSSAAGGRHEGIVELMLERNDIDPNRADSDGRTPFWYAALRGRERIVELLLERNDIDPDRADSHGRTPFSSAAGSGHEGIVKMLLEKNDIDPGRADKKGQTPFSWAAGNGKKGIVQLLLERNDIDPHRADWDGRTPFSFAAGSGREGIVALLLERNDIDPDRADSDARTPLLWAAKNGCEATVRILIARKDVNPDRADYYGRTPFYWAAGNGHRKIVELLLERTDVNPDRADSDGRTPISWAADYGHEVIVKMLLDRNDINPDRADDYGRTLFSLAVERGHVHVVKLLEERRNLIVKSTAMDESSKAIARGLPQPSERPFKRVRLF